MKSKTNKRARRDSRRASSTERTRKDKEIARLRRELDAEKRRNARLERKLAALHGAQGCQEDTLLGRFRLKAGSRSRAEGLRDTANRSANRYRKNSFFRYLWEAVMESALMTFMTKLLLYLRRIRVIQIVLSVLLAAGALTAVAVVSAAMLPFLLFGTALLTVAAALRSHRMNFRLRQELAGKRVRVLIPTGKKSFEENAFFIRNARSMAAEGDCAVIAVSPFLVSRRGLGGQGGYFTARKEAEGLFVVRRHYFFTLRRRVLDTLDGEITLIY